MVIVVPPGWTTTIWVGPLSAASTTLDRSLGRLRSSMLTTPLVAIWIRSAELVAVTGTRGSTPWLEVETRAAFP
jgi:hypothetical protein